MRGIGALLRDAHGCTVSLLPVEQPGVLPDGWDCKDAIEADGWTYEQVQAFLARAVALVDTPQAEPAAAAESKKIDSPVGTQGSDWGAEDAGGDADLVALDADGGIADVMAQGAWHVRDGAVVRRGPFE